MIFIPRSPCVAKRIEWVGGYINFAYNKLNDYAILLRYPFETFLVSLHSTKNPQGERG